MATLIKPSSDEGWISTLSPATINYLDGRRLDEVEVVIPDLAGTARGKSMPAYKFDPEQNFYLPISIFYQTISGEYVDMEIQNQWREEDIVLVPDISTTRAVPWTEDATLQVICDMNLRSGAPVPYAPRNVLRRVVALYKEKNWQPVVAPEMEFYLTKPNTDPNEAIEPPVGRTGRKGSSRQVYSMAAVEEYGNVIDTIYDFAELQGLPIDTMIQEGGAGQIEINLPHGDPLKLADMVFYFKRTIREAALRNGVFATFMAKPIRDQPGSAMHLHQSIVDAKTGANIFSTADGEPSAAFFHFIGGSQKYLMQTLPLLAPYVNSYRRIAGAQSAPKNVEWASDNRTTGLRVPISAPDARRVENRIIGMDCNPYLAIATSLAAGYLGITGRIEPRPAVENQLFDVEQGLPLSLDAALDLFEDATEMHELLDPEFARLYYDIKRAENGEYLREITPWEREHLLLNV